ncbi:BPTI/Kunitz domain-containing protein [Larkinella humicola]|uniref:Proteinase inhibitor I4 serpin n=1 Tax=Larkinella humicola TaxID=2607654 RepID=A0A5N1JP61_9BACT|nr:BPTI/Kunitz domain-containing protein [Larkinella humicola]KAA9357257.1 proteinase inhibitor I4 serpin [Larkinella humicola]
MKPITAFVLIAISLIGCEKDSIKSPRCELKPESGPCFAAFTRYYYDPSEKVCKSFVWGGCGGVVPFETLAECEACLRHN